MPRDDVMVLGRELTEDGEVLGPIGLMSEVWDKNLLVAGEVGSGKTTTATTAITAVARRKPIGFSRGMKPT
jgi:Flp pilus assembly CpaF family ATPase